MRVQMSGQKYVTKVSKFVNNSWNIITIELLLHQVLMTQLDESTDERTEIHNQVSKFGDI